MPSEMETAERYLHLLKTLNSALKEPFWDKSLYLKAVRDKLQKERDTLQTQLAEIGVTETSSSTDENTLPEHSTIATPAGMMPVYISLYCSEGSKIEAWRKVLATVEVTSVSRPIYSQEAHVEALIRNKPSKKNEAYAGIFIKSLDIARASMGVSLKDKAGNNLLVLKKGAIIQANIFLFVHESGRYGWKDGHLIKQSEDQKI